MDNEFNDRLEKIITSLGEDDVKQMITTINRMIEITNKLNFPTQKVEMLFDKLIQIR